MSYGRTFRLWWTGRLTSLNLPDRAVIPGPVRFGVLKQRPHRSRWLCLLVLDFACFFFLLGCLRPAYTSFCITIAFV